MLKTCVQMPANAQARADAVSANLRARAVRWWRAVGRRVSELRRRVGALQSVRARARISSRAASANSGESDLRVTRAVIVLW